MSFVESVEAPWIPLMTSVCILHFLIQESIRYDATYVFLKKQPVGVTQITHGRGQIKVFSLAAEHMSCNKEAELCS